MSPNFTQCAADYLRDGPIPEFVWNGSVRMIPKDPRTQVTYHGCLKLCGAGEELYPWSHISSTITTWILPILGIMLQAPFESNEVRRTVLATARWIGSPISSLSYILWNIAVSGKCAMMVDLAVGYDSRVTTLEEVRNFNDIRDSFYILMVMNQFEVRPIAHNKKGAERLLRFALFGKDLTLMNNCGRKLAEVRGEVAQSLRRKRRRGAVPVFISTAWFLFALALSIQHAFGLVGRNATAHGLALGLLLGWLPILVLCSIVDRNPLSAHDIQMELNLFIRSVCNSLRDPRVAGYYVDKYRRDAEGSYTETGELLEERMSTLVQWVAQLDDGDFFVTYAGQGRTRWHYGVAHPILSDIENCYVASRGRYWMRHELEARRMLMMGSTERGLFWFDYRQLWQISNAVVLVLGTCLGAFIISYFTPTVGLACRSLGYLVFAVIAFGLLLIEFLIWRLTSGEPKIGQRPHLSPLKNGALESVALRNPIMGALKCVHTWILFFWNAVEKFLKMWIPIFISWTYFSSRSAHLERLQEKYDTLFCQMRLYTIRDWSEILFFIPGEIANMGWLARVILFQTFGKYVSCYCHASSNGVGRGYVDFAMMEQVDLRYVYWSWITGSVIASSVLALGLVYIIIEWCLQSHMSTLDRESARIGLQRTRAFRRWTYYARYPLQKLVLSFNEIWNFGRREEHKQKTLIWTKNVTYIPDPKINPNLTLQTGSVFGVTKISPHSSRPRKQVPIGRSVAQFDAEMSDFKAQDIHIESHYLGDDTSSTDLVCSDASSANNPLPDQPYIETVPCWDDGRISTQFSQEFMPAEHPRPRPTHQRQQTGDIVGLDHSSSHASAAQAGRNRSRS